MGSAKALIGLHFCCESLFFHVESRDPRLTRMAWLPERIINLRKQMWRYLVAACTLAMASSLVPSAIAQTAEVKEKPPMYSYVADWSIPRAQWAEMEKVNASDKAILDKAIANGALVAYGDDTNLVHQPDATTHDDWWSSMSMAGLLNVLDEMTKSGTTVSPVLASATKHSDNIFVSRYYNWHSGSWKGAYTHVGSYKLKADAPDDAIDVLSKNMIVPLMEKLLADGTIHEYEVDSQAIHSQAPGLVLDRLHRGKRRGSRQGQRGLAGDVEGESAQWDSVWFHGRQHRTPG